MIGEWIRKPLEEQCVIFVHGILSSGESCWTNSNGTYWPELLRCDSELNSLGIYVFSYETSVFSGSYRLSDIVDALKEFMRLDRVSENRYLVFVCHSMGGIVVRKFLVEQSIDLMHKQIGLFLIASPSLGSTYADCLSPLAILLGHAQADALRFIRNNEWLKDLDKDFINLKESGNLQLRGKELVEDKFVFLQTFLRRQVVEPFAGARYFGEAFKVPSSDHFSIAKPKDKDAIQHRLLCRFILENMPSEGSDARIGAHRVAPFFKSPEDLRAHVEALTTLSKEKRESIPSASPPPVASQSQSIVAGHEILPALGDILAERVYPMLRSNRWLGRYVTTLAQAASVSDETMLAFCRSRSDIGLFTDGDRWVAALSERLNRQNPPFQRNEDALINEPDDGRRTAMTRRSTDNGSGIDTDKRVGHKMIDALLVPVIKNAVDFLFDEGREVLKAHLARRDSASNPPDNDSPSPENLNTTGVFAMKKDDALRRQIDEATVERHKDELAHLLRLQEIQSRNYHLAKEQEASWGRELVPPVIVNRIIATETDLADTTLRIREVLNTLYT